MDFEKIASTMTNKEILAAINVFLDEEQRRKKAQRQKLIDNFHNAFSELRNAGIMLRYYEEPDECCSPVFIKDWDNFEFC